MSQSLGHAAEQFYKEELETLLEDTNYASEQEFLLETERWREQTKHPVTERPRYTENLLKKLKDIEIGEQLSSTELTNQGENAATYGGIINFLTEEDFLENPIGQKVRKNEKSVEGAIHYQYLVEKDFLEKAVEYIEGRNDLEEVTNLLPDYNKIRETFTSSSRFDEVKLSKYKPHNVGWPSREKQRQEKAFEDLLRYLNNLHVLENNNGRNSFDPQEELVLEGSEREIKLSLKLLDHI